MQNAKFRMQNAEFRMQNWIFLHRAPDKKGALFFILSIAIIKVL